MVSYVNNEYSLKCTALPAFYSSSRSLGDAAVGGAGTAPPAGQLQTLLPPRRHSQGEDKTAWGGERGVSSMFSPLLGLLIQWWRRRIDDHLLINTIEVLRKKKRHNMIFCF